MTRLWKRFAVTAVLLLSVSLITSAALWGMFGSKSSTSNIVDFAPTSFPAKASAKFFYSIDNELKCSDQIDPHAPTLARGPISNFLVSPDGNKIAVVVKGRLLIIGMDSVLGEVAEADSIYRRHKPIGRQFFRNENFQWSRDSKSLFLIRDEYYRSSGSQLFSEKGELWRYDLESKSLQLILRPFVASSYFLGLNSGIYYSEPTDRGNLQLKFFNGRTSTTVGEANAAEIPEISGGSNERPFYSFSILDYEKALVSLNVRLVGQDGIKALLINDKKYLSVTQGKGWDGYYYCTELLRSAFLPGGKFFLFNVPYCGNYNGQLLFDVGSARYQKLPPDTVVFVTLNSETYNHYRISASGIEVK